MKTSAILALAAAAAWTPGAIRRPKPDRVTLQYSPVWVLLSFSGACLLLAAGIIWLIGR